MDDLLANNFPNFSDMRVPRAMRRVVRTRINMVNRSFCLCSEEVQKVSPATSSGIDCNGLSRV
jgi:hypothetical protein